MFLLCKDVASAGSDGNIGIVMKSHAKEHLHEPGSLLGTEIEIGVKYGS